MVCSFAQLKSACILSYFWLSNLYAIAITCFPVAMYLMILYKEKEIRSNIFLFFLVSILLFCSTLRNRILGQRETCIFPQKFTKVTDYIILHLYYRWSISGVRCFSCQYKALGIIFCPENKNHAYY